MRQGEIVQCQGYMGARAQNRPCTQKRDRVEESVEGREAATEDEEQEEKRAAEGRGKRRSRGRERTR